VYLFRGFKDGIIMIDIGKYIKVVLTVVDRCEWDACMLMLSGYGYEWCYDGDGFRNQIDKHFRDGYVVYIVVQDCVSLCYSHSSNGYFDRDRKGVLVIDKWYDGFDIVETLEYIKMDLM